MRIILLSPSYNIDQLNSMRKGLKKNIPFIVRADNGKRYFVTHGTKSGKVWKEDEFQGMFDEILCCFKDTGVENWITTARYNGRIYLIQVPNSEYNLACNFDYICELISQGLSE